MLIEVWSITVQRKSLPSTCLYLYACKYSGIQSELSRKRCVHIGHNNILLRYDPLTAIHNNPKNADVLLFRKADRFFGPSSTWYTQSCPHRWSIQHLDILVFTYSESGTSVLASSTTLRYITNTMSALECLRRACNSNRSSKWLNHTKNRTPGHVLSIIAYVNVAYTNCYYS